MTQAARPAGEAADVPEPEATEPSEGGEARPGNGSPEPYDELDEVTRAKLRLLDFARQYDAEHPSRPMMRHPMCTATFGAFSFGFVTARVPPLRRYVVRMAMRGFKALGRHVLFKRWGKRKPSRSRRRRK